MSQDKLKSNFSEAFKPTLQSFSIIGLAIHIGSKDSGFDLLLMTASLHSHPTAQGARLFVTNGYIHIPVGLTILQQFRQSSFPLLI